MFKKLSTPLLVMATAFTLTGCMQMAAHLSGVTIVNPYDSLEVAEHTKIRQDRHTGVTVISGPDVTIQGGNLDYLNKAHLAYIEKGKIKTNNIVVDVQFINRAARINKAYSDGKELQVIHVDQNVHCSGGSCFFQERVSIPIDKQVWERGHVRGFDVKLVGSGGSLVVEIPSSYVMGFESAVKKFLSK